MAETNLATLIRAMQPQLASGTFVFASLPIGVAVPGNVAPVMLFRETEGMTLIVGRGDAEAAGLAFSFPSRMITLEIQSSLEAVGFLAAITARLAAAGIAVNPVSGFHHDHLFVPEARAEDAIEILRAMAAER